MNIYDDLAHIRWKGLKKQDMEMGPPIYGRSFSTQQENFLQSLQNRGFQERNFQNGLPNGTRQSESSWNISY